MTPAVSVVVATYNYGRFIAVALDSIRAQSFADWEVVIVDDGSTDETPAVVRPFLADARFRLVSQDHLGQPVAKNRGLVECRGEFIAFLDADDTWRPEKLKCQLECFRRSPAAGVVYSRRVLIDPAGTDVGGDDRQFHRGDVLDAMFRDNFVCFSSAMIRRLVFDHLGGFDTRLGLAIDYDWWLRVARHYVFDFVDEPLVEYRVGHANLSRRVADRLDTALAVMRRFRNHFDWPPRLDDSQARLAFAETLRHRGLVARRQPSTGMGWLMRSLAVRPLDTKTWKAVVAALTPARLRRLARRGPDWEASLAPAGEVA